MTVRLATHRRIVLLLAVLVYGCTGPKAAQRCLESPDNMLYQTRFSLTGYACRPARNECEKGFIQNLHGENECEANASCSFEGGGCYCPPFAHCVCGGGPPPTCVPVQR